MTSNYKILGQVFPNNGSSTLYQAPAGKQAVVSTIAVSNISSEDRKFSIFAQPTAQLGDSWEYKPSLFNNANNTITNVVKNNDDIIVFSSYYPTYQESIQKSSDGGNTWSYVSKTGFNGEYDAWRVRANDDGSRLIAVTNQKEVYVSIDAAVTWTKIADPLSFNGYIVEAAASDTDFIVVAYNYNTNSLMSFVSTDGLTMTESTPSSLSDITLTGFNQGTEMTSNYEIRSLSIGSTSYFGVVYYTSGGSGGSGGGGGSSWVTKLIKTSDAGLTWTQVDLSSFFTQSVFGGNIPQLMTIKSLNSNIVLGFDYATSYNYSTGTYSYGYAKIIVSSDDGQTWTAPTLPADYASIHDGYFANNKYYFLVSLPGYSGGSSGGYVLSTTNINDFSESYQSLNQSDSKFVLITSDKIINTSKNISTLNMAPSQYTAIAYGVLIPAFSSVTFTSGITLAAGEKISVGDSNYATNAVNYTAFGSEVTP